jgi:hypothetical protein
MPEYTFLFKVWAKPNPHEHSMKLVVTRPDLDTIFF